jgi:hypothetical protein
MVVRRVDMKEIKLTQGKVALIDDGDFDVLSEFTWYAHKQRTGNWYARRSGEIYNGKQPNVLMHRVVTLAEDDVEIDHVDGCVLNCQKENLRSATRTQNQQNKKKQRTIKGGQVYSSHYKGVSWNKKANKWHAQIRVDGELQHLGYHDLEIEAAMRYDMAAREAFGEFARINFE